MLKPPTPDPTLDPFRGGVAVLKVDGHVAGHVATTVSTFWSPLSFSRQRQWWVWYIVVWSDGHREPSAEDYPPWGVVREIQSGTFSWDEDDARRGTYGGEWLAQAERERMLVELNIGPEDF